MEVVAQKPFKLLAFKGFVPDILRYVVFAFFALTFQFSGGIYLSLANQMVGSLVLIQQDIMFAGYASFVGMTIIFPLLFPLKFRFPSKVIFMTTSVGLIFCNIISMNTGSLPLLIIVSFFAGIFRMWGFFECMSTLQLKITPTRDFAVFFPVVYFLVLGSIQLSGITAGYIAYFYQWRYMQLLIIGSLSLVTLLSLLLFRNFHMNPPQPLSKIDWLGAILWSILLLLIIYLLEYGEYYDWFASTQIQNAAVFSVMLLGINVWRGLTVDHPFNSIPAFRHKNMFTILMLFAAMCILLATSNILQNSYTGAILHYDYLTTLSLNWSVFAGVLAGCLFSYVALVKFDVGYKLMTTIGFLLILFYIAEMYFLISPATNIEKLYLPLMARGAGNAIIYVVLTVYAARTIPFIFFFQVLAIFGFIRTCIGTPLGTAIIERTFLICQRNNTMSLGSELDMQNPIVNTLPLSNLLNEFHRQVFLVSIKEVFGYAAVGGVIIILLTLIARYNLLRKFKMPRFW
jgi:hypothetical protein